MNPCKNPLWNPPAARTARSRTRPPQNLAFWCALALEPPVLEFLGARTARPGTHTPPEPPVLGRPAARTARSTSRPPQNLSFWCALALEPSVLEFPFARAGLSGTRPRQNRAIWDRPGARTARSSTRPPQNLPFWRELALEPPVLEFPGHHPLGSKNWSSAGHIYLKVTGGPGKWQSRSVGFGKHAHAVT